MRRHCASEPTRLLLTACKPPLPLPRLPHPPPAQSPLSPWPSAPAAEPQASQAERAQGLRWLPPLPLLHHHPTHLLKRCLSLPNPTPPRPRFHSPPLRAPAVASVVVAAGPFWREAVERTQKGLAAPIQGWALQDPLASASSCRRHRLPRLSCWRQRCSPHHPPRSSCWLRCSQARQARCLRGWLAVLVAELTPLTPRLPRPHPPRGVGRSAPGNTYKNA